MSGFYTCSRIYALGNKEEVAATKNFPEIA